MEILIIMLVMLIVVLPIVVVWSACVVSSQWSRIEELERDEEYEK